MRPDRPCIASCPETPGTGTPTSSQAVSPATSVAGPARRTFVALLAASAALLIGAGGCASEAPPPTREVGPLEPGSFKATWKVDVDTSRYGPIDNLYLRDDSLIVYTDQNVVQRITSGGRTAFVTSDVVRSVDTLYPPLLMDALGRLNQIEQFLAFPTATSYELLTLDGRPISEAQLRDTGLTSPSTSSAGVAYVGASGEYGGLLLKVDPTRPHGQILEQVLLRGAINSKPAVYQNLVYVADLVGNVYGINESDFSQAWEFPAFTTEVGRGISADVAVDDFGVYAAGTDGTLYCLDRLRGRLKWRYFAGRSLYTRPVPVDNYVYQAVAGTGVVAIPKTEGSANSRQPAWTAENAVDFLSHDDRRVYLLHSDGSIVAHDKQTGEELFRSERNDFQRFARNLDGPRIYAATLDGEVVAIDPVTGRGEIGELASAAPVATKQPS